MTLRWRLTTFGCFAPSAPKTPRPTRSIPLAAQPVPEGSEPPGRASLTEEQRNAVGRVSRLEPLARAPDMLGKHHAAQLLSPEAGRRRRTREREAATGVRAE